MTNEERHQAIEWLKRRQVMMAGAKRMYNLAVEALEAYVPDKQPDEKLEKCRFEYINACRTVTFSTPDTTKKDISDAYAVIRALQPIFGDVPFAKVERGGKE